MATDADFSRYPGVNNSFVAGKMSSKTDEFDGQLEQVVEFFAQSFVEAEAIKLRVVLRQLEEECGTKFASWPREELLKKVWLRLVRLSLSIKNLDLAVLVLAKLKLVQLVLLLTDTKQESTSYIQQHVAFSYVASHFHLDYQPNVPVASCVKSSHDVDCLLELYVNEDDFKKAFDFVDEHLTVPSEKLFRRRVLFHKLAQHQEIDEDFVAALANYKQSGDSLIHSTRIIIKNHANLAFKELKNFCAVNNVALIDFWRQFSSALGSQQQQVARSDLDSDAQQDTLIAELLPKGALDFIQDSGTDKWFNKRRIDLLASTAASNLVSGDRDKLAEFASRCHLNGNHTKAASLYLCLGQVDSFVQLIPKFMDKMKCLRVVNQLDNSPNLLAYHVVDFFCDSKCSKGDDQSSSTLVTSLIKLGLLDAALHEFGRETFSRHGRDEHVLGFVVQTLEDALMRDKQQIGLHLDYIDPELRHSTLGSIQETLNNNNNPTMTTHVITIVILSTTIHLLKMDHTTATIGGHLEELLERLEINCSNLTNLFNEFEFNASDSLLRAASGLVGAAQEKLDVIGDSIVIKEAFKLLIESTASRCLMEGRYRSAAKLYGQIEDHVNGVKCLMRTGDINVVIDYSLLVRDITVTRITLNYLKHSQVDPKVVEDFIAKSSRTDEFSIN